MDALDWAASFPPPLRGRTAGPTYYTRVSGPRIRILYHRGFPMTRLNAWKRASAIFVLCAATAICAQAQVLTSLAIFDKTNGANPEYGPMVQGPDGNFYGTTYSGGTVACSDTFGNICGTVFKVTPDGEITTLYSFCSLANCSDGSNPSAGLVLGTDGNFYGTTSYGGNDTCPRAYSSGCGTVFKMTPEGVLTTLHAFSGTDGENPNGTLVQAADGNFYGAALNGGDMGCYSPVHKGCGTIFRVTPTGEFSRVHRFQGDDGANPFAGLTEGSDGDLYGTTRLGGTYGAGIVFKLAPKGVLTILYVFCSQTGCADGGYPEGVLTLGSDGNFYGTTSIAGTGCGDGCGTVFKMTASGSLATLHEFDYTDGAYPRRRAG
jgi:uncharacterized repeat protein (TIGR03803 family)